MKRLLFALMFFSTAVLADPPTLSQKYQTCAYYAVKGGEYTVIAAAVKGVEDFRTFILADISGVSDPNMQESLKYVADIAWRNRGQTPGDVGMAVYGECVKKLGTTT